MTVAPGEAYHPPRPSETGSSLVPAGSIRLGEEVASSTRQPPFPVPNKDQKLRTLDGALAVAIERLGRKDYAAVPAGPPFPKLCDLFDSSTLVCLSGWHRKSMSCWSTRAARPSRLEWSGQTFCISSGVSEQLPATLSRTLRISVRSDRGCCARRPVADRMTEIRINKGSRHIPELALDKPSALWWAAARTTVFNAELRPLRIEECQANTTKTSPKHFLDSGTKRACRCTGPIAAGG